MKEIVQVSRCEDTLAVHMKCGEIHWFSQLKEDEPYTYDYTEYPMQDDKRKKYFGKQLRGLAHQSNVADIVEPYQ